jgi:hypothetical protein
MGTTAGAQLWRAGQDRDVVFWDRLWSRYVIRYDGAEIRSYPAPSSICLSPSSGHIAWHQKVRSYLHHFGHELICRERGRSMFWVSIGKEKRLVCRKNLGIHVKSIGSDGGRAFLRRKYTSNYI